MGTSALQRRAKHANLARSPASYCLFGLVRILEDLSPMLLRLLLPLMIALSFAPAPLRAQDGAAASYVNPFPESDVYRIQAYGDAFADGLLAGMVEGFAGDSRVDLVRKARTIVGLTRNEFDDDMRNEENVRDPLHVAVVMIGINDRIPLRGANGQRVLVGSPEWRIEYGRRVERLIRALKRRGAAVYWVGLPVMRRNDVNDDVQAMNDVVRQKTYLNGVKYIDTQVHFADDAGNFNALGPDITGKSRQMREADGITFTAVGYRKLAQLLEQDLKRDLMHARSERDIQLAGSEAEQKRVAALRPRLQANEPAAKAGTPAAARDERSPARALQPDQTGEQKADNGRVTLRVVGASGRAEALTLDLLRPAIPGAVVALLTRRDTGERASQMGEVVADEISGGLVVLSSITPAVASNAPGAPRRMSPSQMPYYAVLVKGDRAAAKPGRADDFAWPPVEPDYGFAPPAAKTPPRQAPPAAPQRRPQRLGARE